MTHEQPIRDGRWGRPRWRAPWYVGLVAPVVLMIGVGQLVGWHEARSQAAEASAEEERQRIVVDVAGELKRAGADHLGDAETRAIIGRHRHVRLTALSTRPLVACVEVSTPPQALAARSYRGEYVVYGDGRAEESCVHDPSAPIGHRALAQTTVGTGRGVSLRRVGATRPHP